MAKIKHSKYKNSGILFELLVRTITADTLKGNESPAINLLKKFFVKTELGREYKLYESALKVKTLSEGQANIVISTILESSQKINRGILKREKYNLIKEIKEHYNINTFFNSKIKNYKQIAALYTLIEGHNSKNITNPEQLITSKIIILEHLTKSQITPSTKNDVLEEYKEYDANLRILTYKILLEKFNSKYSNLNLKQKYILKEFINSVDNSSELKKIFNYEIGLIREELQKHIVKTPDQTTKIKLEEIIKFMVELGKTCKIQNEHLIDLLQYHSLLETLRKINGKV